MEAKKRIDWIDVLKYLSIMTVILEHLEATCDELSVLYTPWFLEIFFFSAGYVHRAHQDTKAFFVKKIRGLFVPWLVFSFLDISISQIVSFREHGSYGSELLWNLAQIRNCGAQLWFIPAIFTAYIPFYFFIEWYEKKPSPQSTRRTVLFWLLAAGIFLAGVLYSHLTASHPFPWGSSSLPWHIDYASVALFWMVMGYFLRQRWEPTMDRLNTRRGRLLLLAVYLFVVYQPYLMSWRLPERIWEFMARFGTPLLGITLICSFAKTVRPNKYFRYIGQNTILIFAFHGKLLGFCEGMLRRFAGGIYASILANRLSSSVFAIVFAFALSLVLIVPIYIVNKYFPFLVGRKNVGKLRS